LVLKQKQFKQLILYARKQGEAEIKHLQGTLSRMVEAIAQRMMIAK
jgi:hypothetical protein